ncbi:MAG: hypothetical protein ACI4UU_01220 [Clostridia bacterium]
MKKTIKILLLFLIIFLMCTSICLANDVAPISSEASPEVTTQENPEDTLEEPSNQFTITNNDVYLISEEDIVMSELVNGNTFIIGKNVTITGQVAGDLYVIAQNLTIDSSAVIYNNIFALASEMTVKGEVNDVYAVANTFNLDTSAYIGRDLKLLSENVSLSGIVMKNAYISSKVINFGSENASYVIRGNLNYSSPNQASIPENAVMGEVQFNQVEEKVESVGEVISQYVISFLNVILLAVVVILLSSFVTPNFANKATYCMTKRPFSTAGIGILSFIFIPIVCIVLLFLGISSYLSLALITLYALVLSITISILGISIGNYFANKFKEKTKAKTILLSLASVACLWLLQLVPYVGAFVSLFILIFGLGIFVFSLFVKVKKEESTPVIENTTEDK